MKCASCGNNHDQDLAYCTACGKPLAATATQDILEVNSTLVPGAEVLGKYRIEGLIERLPTHEVYRAEHIILGRPVRVYLLELTLCGTLAARERFVALMRKLAKVRDPRLLDIYEPFELPGRVGVVAEASPAESLAAELSRVPNTPWNPQAIRSWLTPALLALQKVHDAGVVHGRLGPASMGRVGPGGLVKLINLFRPRLEPPELTSPNPPPPDDVRFLAPEWLGEPDSVQHTADIYSMGCILYQLATGQPVFPGDDSYALMTAHLAQRPPEPRTVHAGISEGLERVILRALSKHPAYRFESALDMAAALDDHESYRRPVPVGLPPWSVNDLIRSAPPSRDDQQTSRPAPATTASSADPSPPDPSLVGSAPARTAARDAEIAEPPPVTLTVDAAADSASEQAQLSSGDATVSATEADTQVDTDGQTDVDEVSDPVEAVVDPDPDQARSPVTQEQGDLPAGTSQPDGDLTPTKGRDESQASVTDRARTDERRDEHLQNDDSAPTPAAADGSPITPGDQTNPDWTSPRPPSPRRRHAAPRASRLQAQRHADADAPAAAHQAPEPPPAAVDRDHRRAQPSETRLKSVARGPRRPMVVGVLGGITIGVLAALLAHYTSPRLGGDVEIKVDKAEERVEQLLRDDGQADDMIAIPSGGAVIGASPAFDDIAPDQPLAKVRHIGAFAIDRLEVSTSAYDACVEEGMCEPSATPAQGSDDEKRRLPVTGVTWRDAQTFCEARGKRLPTEAEWEKAARGPFGHRFPWGDHGEACARAALSGTQCAPLSDAEPIGTRPLGASPYGVENLAGNVWEWTADAIERGATREARWGPGRVIKGGDWASEARSASWRGWNPPESRSDRGGFRCARSLPDDARPGMHEIFGDGSTPNRRLDAYLLGAPGALLTAPATTRP